MVIQQIRVEKPAYRLVVYGDQENPRHRDFSSEQALLDALCAAMPNFGTSELSLNPLATGQGSVVFTGEFTLNAMQLSVLGLNK